MSYFIITWTGTPTNSFLRFVCNAGNGASNRDVLLLFSSLFFCIFVCFGLVFLGGGLFICFSD